jgi:prolyl 4-hydroxylase
MAIPMADVVPITEMFEVPAWLAQQTSEQQAAAPYCGLGFKRGQLPPELLVAMQERVRAATDQFRPEHDIPELETTEPNVIPSMLYEDKAFNDSVSRALQPAHEAWSGMKLAESACYGFRIYQRGSYLHNHVDRTQTHIISSTICVDHQLDEPWPLYIEDIDGKAHQVNMEPGEFVFYEGARLIHGRPWPLKGAYYIGMFVHYSPEGRLN